MCVYVYMCIIYIYIYMCIHPCIHTYTHTYINVRPRAIAAWRWSRWKQRSAASLPCNYTIVYYTPRDAYYGCCLRVLSYCLPQTKLLHCYRYSLPAGARVCPLDPSGTGKCWRTEQLLSYSACMRVAHACLFRSLVDKFASMICAVRSSC